jgi:2-dehydro-3-deoxyphosphogluconate aldolase/(4S)-4-hydroxy-2-oxoglutarate aldolase
MDVARFQAKPIMGILRGVAVEQLEPLIQAVASGGLETIEVTMNTPQAPLLIRKAREAAQGRLMIGAGTVLSLDSLKIALDSGATFVVMPVLIKEVMAYCVKNAIPVFPGALTPQEIYTAWEEGATMVKVFPAKCFGPEYFREIRGPFQDIALLACGGVTPENMRDYFAHGASAIAVGAQVFRKEWLSNNEYARISFALKGYLQCLP